MLRVNSHNVLIVPPFEAAWLTDEQLQLPQGSGCIEFEVKGQNDAAVIFRSSAGGRRWQFAENVSQQQLNLRHYTVILGSHRNSCLKIERNGQDVFSVKDEPAATLSGREFQRYWIELKDGCITIGCGAPGSQVLGAWCDPSPLPALKFVGLTAWDTYLSYRSIATHRCTTGKHGKVHVTPASTSSVPTLLAQCSKVIATHLCPASICGCLKAADAMFPVLEELQDHLVSYLAKHLPEVVTADLAGFCALSSCAIVQLLLSPFLVCNERSILDAILRWLEEDPDCRESMMSDILPLIRFPLMDDAELQAVAAHPLACRSAALQELVTEARQFGRASAPGAPDAQEQLPRATLSVDSKRQVHNASSLQAAALRRQRRRNLGAARELMYLFDGDHEGVCYHFGTDMGTKQWVNPVLTGRLQVKASSPLCRYTDARAMAGSKLVRSNLAGPQHVPGSSSHTSWWLLDLGPHHRLACNYYSLRHDASNAFLRSWVLQGCEDAGSSHWIDLRHHHNDTTITMPGQYASWPVVSHAATTPFRMLRILLTGNNASSLPRRDTVNLSSFEFYGYLHTVNAQEAL